MSKPMDQLLEITRTLFPDHASRKRKRTEEGNEESVQVASAAGKELFVGIQKEVNILSILARLENGQREIVESQREIKQWLARLEGKVEARSVLEASRDGTIINLLPPSRPPESSVNDVARERATTQRTATLRIWSPMY